MSESINPILAGNGVAYASSEDPNFEIREGLRPASATFTDGATETAYRNFLSGPASDRERLLQVLGIISYLSYAALDLFVAGSLALEFIALRFFLVLPLVGLCVALTSLPKFRRHIEYSTTFGFAAMSLSIVYMIYKMPVVGAPPYIIGLLVVMIFTSCLMRVRFMIAAPVFISIAAAYCTVLIARPGIPPAEIISGYFFMLSVAAVAVVTNYLQERRARETWLRNVQRERDSARIEQLLVEATAADRSKINFLSILTHELRTPLHQIIGFSEISRNQVAGGEAENRIAPLDQITLSARDLLKKLGQMLRYADATAGKLNYSIDEIPILEIIDQIADQFAPSASAKSIRLDVSQVEPATLSIDQHHTAYALSNLVENAFNASAAGSTVKIVGAHTNDKRYRLQISDNGVGMSPEKIASAFAPFEQTESGRSRSREGIGLGLSIAKLILNGQGAVLSIRSAPGIGTVATVSFKADANSKCRAHDQVPVSA